MKLSLTGLNHNTAPVEVRERLAFQPALLASAVHELCHTPGVQESVILSTCNRVEIAVTADDSVDVSSTLSDFLARVREVDPQWLRQYLYHHQEKDAIRHLFRVASSLDSMVLGEPQILGQLKDAYEVAKTQGALTGFLDTVMTRAFGVAKRVRSETEIGQNAVSISYAAVELARQIFGSLRGKKVLIIGAGKMSELAARHLERNGVSEIAVTNRSPERAKRWPSCSATALSTIKFRFGAAGDGRGDRLQRRAAFHSHARGDEEGDRRAPQPPDVPHRHRSAT
jgi:glutamyl-tRNA reductase